MSTGQRLPEDIAAEQAYLADLRTQQEAAERKRAEARRQELAALGLLDTPAPSHDVLAPAGPPPAAPAEAAVVLSASTPPAVRPASTPASLTPEALAALPPEVRQLVEEALARQQADSAAVPGALPPTANAGAPRPPATADVFAAPVAEPPAPTAQPPGAKRELTEEEIERLEKVVLGEVQVDLADKGSVLVRGKNQTFVQRVGSSIDNVLGLLLGRKTW